MKMGSERHEFAPRRKVFLLQVESHYEGMHSKKAELLFLKY